MDSTSSHVFRMGAAFIGGSCLALFTVMAISTPGNKSQNANAFESTNLFGSLASHSATRSAMIPKPMAGLSNQMGWRDAVARPGAPTSGWADSRRSVTASAFQNEEVATRYATALLDAVKEKGSDLEAVHDSIETLRLAMNDAPELKQALFSKIYTAEQRGNIAAEIVKNPQASKFFKVLIKNGRADVIVEAIEAFDQLYCKQKGIVTAKVTSAKELSEEEQFKIAKKIQQMADCKSVKIKPVVDKRLIGGVVMEWGSEKLDLSYRGKLDQIKSSLMAADWESLLNSGKPVPA